MKFSANFIPYLTFKVGLLPRTTALIEPEATTQTNVALASFVDTAALPPPDTAFFAPSEAEVPDSFVSDLTIKEHNLGLEAGSTKIDGRSGKMVSLNLKKPILPGDGVGNHLLWSVGPTGRSGDGQDGHGPPVSREEWSQLGVEAVKVSSICLSTCLV
jgi:hypothetical protein